VPSERAAIGKAIEEELGDRKRGRSRNVAQMGHNCRLVEQPILRDAAPVLQIASRKLLRKSETVAGRRLWTSGYPSWTWRCCATGAAGMHSCWSSGGRHSPEILMAMRIAFAALTNGA
jgi:hypothetical protein